MSATQWEDLVPDEIAIHQRAWERRRAIWRMRELGFNFYEIGARFGVHQSRAATLYHKAQNDRRRGMSPVEAWLADDAWLGELWDALRRRSGIMERRVRAAEKKGPKTKSEAYAQYYLQRFRRDVAEKEAALARARDRLAIAEAEYAADKMVTGNPDGVPTLLRGVLAP